MSAFPMSASFPTVKTADGKLSAHYENTVALTDEGAIILTDAHV